MAVAEVEGSPRRVKRQDDDGMTEWDDMSGEDDNTRMTNNGGTRGSSSLGLGLNVGARLGLGGSGGFLGG